MIRCLNDSEGKENDDDDITGVSSTMEPNNNSISLNNNNVLNSDSCSPLIGQRQMGEAPNLSVILTIRLLMQGKEVGSIIGKKGDHIKIIRDESGAKINISDGSCPERIVTITGNLDTITKAFTMICRKFEDDMTQLPNSVPKPPITFRLIVPATQCGSLIGKGGSKIKEIREATGASIQVASEMLPNSTERAVTISGNADAIIQCMHYICQILLESPPKGATVPYRPKPSINPLLLATSAAAAAAAQQPMLQPTMYSQLNGPELTKIHPLNPLLQPLPGFNPTVLGGGSYPGVFQLQAGQPFMHTDLALSNAGGYKTADNRAINGGGYRDDGQKFGADGANLSQYFVNTSAANVAELQRLSQTTLPVASAADVGQHHANFHFSAASLPLSRYLTVSAPSTMTSGVATGVKPNIQMIPFPGGFLYPFGATLGVAAAGPLSMQPRAAAGMTRVKLASVTADKMSKRFSPY